MASEVSETRQPESINVTIFKNGDINYRGARVLLNKRKTKDLDTFCDNVTSVVKPREGCVRRLATPNHGTRIQDLDQLEPGGMYVAMCDNKFKKLSYAEGPKKQASLSPREIKPVQHSSQYRAKSSQYRKQQVTGVNFRVYPNGDELNPGCPFNLKPFQMKYGWGVILDLVSESLQKCCYGLCTLDGQMVTDISSLNKDAQYVALGPHERFQPKQYGLSPQASRNASRKREPLPPIKKGAGRSENTSAGSQQENEPYHARCTPRPKTVLKVRPDGRPFISPPGGKKRPPARKPVERRQPPPRAAARKQQEQEKSEEEDVFHAKPVKHKPNNSRNKKQRDYDNDEEKGVFRAKDENKETKGAEEVNESDDTKTSLPIDQVEAEEVEEENTSSNAQAEESAHSPTKKKKKKLFGLF